MIVLDSSVLAAPMRGDVEHPATGWLDRQLLSTLYLTAIGMAELLLGLEVAKENGRLPRSVPRHLVDFVTHGFAGRILPFDLAAARCYGPLVRQVQLTGVPITCAEGQIAAIARSRGFAVAARHKVAFAASGLEVVDPWNPDSWSRPDLMNPKTRS